MNKDNCKFYSFMRATRGNWRNTLYVKCCCRDCPYGYSGLCEGFLLAADADGSLIITPVEAVRQFTGEAIEPAECRGTLPRKMFEAVFSQYIEWHTTSDTDCSLRQLCQITERPQSL